MSARKIVLSMALLCFSVAWLPQPPQAAAAATPLPYRVLSESYYRVDPAAATIAARVHATFYNSGTQDIAALPLWAMPNATDIVVTLDGANLVTKVVPFLTDFPTVIGATLPKPLKPSQKAEVTLTYSVPQQKNNLVSLAPGSMEAMFVSQGAGSFLLIDVPTAAENYFDPGCIPAADQPREVRDGGLTRWVCGEVLRAVLHRSAETQSSCAHLEDRCRQSSLKDPFSAFAQSITDTTSRGLLEADVQLAEKSVHLTFRFFRQNQQWADGVFAMARASLPKLEALFGYPYPFDSLSIRESTFIEDGGAAGIAYYSGGDVLVTPIGGAFDAEVIVHELAHQWAGGNLSAAWEAEGLAEYGMRRLAPGLGFTPGDRKWESFPYTDNLALWGEGSTVRNADYWYGKAGAFFFAYETAIGGAEKMTAVLGQITPSSARAPFDRRWLMDAGENVSGANLDGLFLKWVFNSETADASLMERRVARDLVKGMQARAATLGLAGTPSDIAANLDAWAFGSIAGQVDKAGPVLDSYAAVVKLGADAGLEPSPAVAKSWGTDTLAHTRSLIDDQRLTIGALADAANRLSDQSPDSAALKRLAEARESYSAGDFTAAKRLAASATTTASNEVTAATMLAIAREKQANYRESFLGRVGLLFATPDADLDRAQRDYDAGDAASALKLARSAYDSWNDADALGLERLALLAATMCALSFVVWWLLRRLDGGGARDVLVGSRISLQGHSLGSPDSRRPGWEDWENLK